MHLTVGLGVWSWLLQVAVRLFAVKFVLWCKQTAQVGSMDISYTKFAMHFNLRCRLTLRVGPSAQDAFIRARTLTIDIVLCFVLKPFSFPLNLVPDGNQPEHAA